jgi:hypothetical protein
MNACREVIHKARILVPGALLLLLSGCPTIEVAEQRVTLHEHGMSGSMTLFFYNIESERESVGDHRADFADVIEMWESDGYLLGAMSKGKYVKDRELWVEWG